MTKEYTKLTKDEWVKIAGVSTDTFNSYVREIFLSLLDESNKKNC